MYVATRPSVVTTNTPATVTWITVFITAGTVTRAGDFLIIPVFRVLLTRETVGMSADGVTSTGAGDGVAASTVAGTGGNVFPTSDVVVTTGAKIFTSANAVMTTSVAGIRPANVVKPTADFYASTESTVADAGAEENKTWRWAAPRPRL